MTDQTKAEEVAANLENVSWCWDLAVAAQVGDHKLVQLHQCPSDAVLRNSRGWSAVMYASAAGHSDLVETLLDLARQGGQAEEARSQALDTAVNYNNLTMISFLIDRDLVGIAEMTSALLHASSLGLTNVARHLLLNGADINFTDAEGHSAMSLAWEHGDPELMGLLLSAQVNSRPNHSLTASQNKKGDISEFCVNLLSNIENYDRVQTLQQFLEILQLPQLWSMFLNEEVDFGVFLSMGDLDLNTIGVTDTQIRNLLLKGQLQVISYFEQIFGANIVVKLFR